MAAKDYFELIRTTNCIMAAAAAAIGYFVAVNGTELNPKLLLAMAGAFAVCGAGQAINDYFDIEVDIKKNPQKPLASGKINPQNALAFSAALFAAGIGMSYFINFEALAIALSFSALLFFYSWKMQKAKFLGNIVVALGTAFTLVYGAAVAGNYQVAGFFAASAFFANIGRELTKDLEDKNADKGTKNTLAHIFPQKTVQALIIFSYALASATAASVWVSKKQSNIFFISLVLLGSLTLFVSWLFLTKGSAKTAQKLSKAAMIVSLAAFASWVA